MSDKNALLLKVKFTIAGSLMIVQILENNKRALGYKKSDETSAVLPNSLLFLLNTKTIAFATLSKEFEQYKNDLYRFAANDGFYGQNKKTAVKKKFIFFCKKLSLMFEDDLYFQIPEHEKFKFDLPDIWVFSIYKN